MSNQTARTPGPTDLLTLNRAATVARLLAGVAHEVNNALQVIGGTTELLQDHARICPHRLPTDCSALPCRTPAPRPRFRKSCCSRGRRSTPGRTNLREIANRSVGAAFVCDRPGAAVDRGGRSLDRPVCRQRQRRAAATGGAQSDRQRRAGACRTEGRRDSSGARRHPGLVSCYGCRTTVLEWIRPRRRSCSNRSSRRDRAKRRADWDCQWHDSSPNSTGER